MGDSPQSASVKSPQRWRAVGFVILTFGCWFLFASLARVVIKCAPPFPCAIQDLKPPSPLPWPDAIVLMVTLGVALWASRRAVFPPED